MLATNQILQKGRYRIIDSFGQDETGGMYEAYDTVSNTTVVLRESVGKFGKIITSIQLEAINTAFAGSAKVLKEIKHESLVSVQDYFSEIGCQYLVLEAVTGWDLAKFLEPGERGPSLVDVLSWADQLLAAVGYLHQLSPPVIHNDITPENVKLTSNQKVKLLTAAVATNQASGDMTPDPSQTIGNDASHYRSLEQLWPGLGTTSQRVILNSYDEKSAGLLMQPPDARSDLYSIGASLYHVLTGTQPSDALDRSITILDGSPDPLQRPDDLDNSIPSEVSDVLMKALEIRREDRFDSAVIMRQILRTAMVRVDERKSEGTKVGGAETPASVETKNAESPTEIESAEVQLELHRSMSGERQRELMDEEARLEKEQNRIHQRRQELEAEKTRQLAEMERLELEAEQARMRVEQERKHLEKEMETEKERGLIAQRLAELEAEQEARCAEVERLEREAKKERIRAEERLLELKAEQERKRAEQKRLEAEAEEERQRAEQRLMELSGANLDVTSQPNEDDQDLLELEPVEKEKAKAMAAAGATDTMKKDAREYGRTPDFTISDLDEPKAFNARIPVIVGGVVIALVGGWMFMSSGVPETKPSAAAVTTSVQTDQTAQKPASDEQSIAVQEKPAESDQSATSGPTANVTIDDRAKRAQLNSAQNKQKKPASSPAKTSPPKKVVTVDDLINDN